MAGTIRFIKGSTAERERLVGASHPTLPDVLNRPILDLLAASGITVSVDANENMVFEGFVPQSVFDQQDASLQAALGGLYSSDFAQDATLQAHDDLLTAHDAAITALETGKADTAHQHDAADIATGTIAPARLGSGVADATKVLFGDGVWRDAPTGGGGGSYLPLSGGTLSGPVQFDGDVSMGFGVDSPGTFAGPTVTPMGATGTTTWAYIIVAIDARGRRMSSHKGTTTTGPAALSAVNFNRVSWAAVPGAVSYEVYRGYSYQNTRITASVGLTATTFDDVGGATATVALPIYDEWGTVNIKRGSLLVSGDGAGWQFIGNADRTLTWDETLLGGTPEIRWVASTGVAYTAFRGAGNNLLDVPIQLRGGNVSNAWALANGSGNKNTAVFKPGGTTYGIGYDSTVGAEALTIVANGAQRCRVDKNGDVEVTTPGRGVILTSPAGTRYRLVVSDAGVLSTVAA